MSSTTQLARPTSVTASSNAVALSVVVEVDGASRGNPGPASYGVIVFEAGTNQDLADRGECIGRTTNNVAEYRGLIAGLKAAAELGATAVKVRMDSEFVVRQMTGVYQVRHEDMVPLHAEATGLLAHFSEVEFERIPREMNTVADAIANAALDGCAWDWPADSSHVRYWARSL